MHLRSILLAALLLTAATPMATAQGSGSDPGILDDYPCGVIVVDFVYPYVWVSQSCLQDWVYYIEDKILPPW